MIDKREAINKLSENLDAVDYGSEEYLENNVSKIDKALLKACEDGNASALKIYYQLTNRLIEQSEQKLKVVLTADEIARRNLLAERELQEFRGKTGYRVEEVSEKSALLSG